MRKTVLLLLVLLFVTAAFAGNGGTVTFTPAETHASSRYATTLSLNGITISISKEGAQKIGDLSRTDTYNIYIKSVLTIKSDVGKILRVDFKSGTTNPVGNFSKAVVGLAEYDNSGLNYSNKKSTEGYWEDKSGKDSVSFCAFNGQVNLTSITVTYGDGTTNSIVTIPTNHTTNSKEYDLTGNRVGKDYKGIVICNGRKKLRR